VVVGVWTYPRNDATGAPAKQLAELDQLMPACTVEGKIRGRPVKVTIDALVVTGTPEGTRVFRTITRSSTRVVE
jgi:hypothetical protein